MKKKIATVLVTFALLLIVIGGLYLHAEYGRVCEVRFYITVDNEYCKNEINWDNASLMSLPEDPHRRGYRFEGWYFDNGTFREEYTPEYFENHDFTRRVSIYAKWTCIHIETTDSIAIAPTCVSEGRKDTICDECHKTLSTETLSIIAHDYEGELNHELIDDEIVFNCSVRCTAGCNYSETFTDVEVNRTVFTAPTCIREGTYLYSYVSHGVTFTDTSPIETIQHEYTGQLNYELVDDEMKFACLVRCVAGCDFTEILNDVEVVTTTSTQPTCDKEGTYLHYYENSEYDFNCKCTSSIEKIPHKINNRFYDDIINEYGYIPYNFPGVTVAATDPVICGNECNAYYECSSCSAFFEIKALRPHVGTWVTVEPATCLEEGLEKLTCTNEDCGVTVTRNTPIIDHIYNLGLVANTNYTEFRLTGTCQTVGCGKEFNQVVQVEANTIQNTCQKDGKITYSYQYEGREYVLERILPKEEHIVGGMPVSYWRDGLGRLPITVEGVYCLGTMETNGCDESTGPSTRSGYYTCESCGSSFSTEVYKPHNWGEWVVVSSPDCTTQGERHRVCADCNNPDDDYPRALGHSYGDYSFTRNEDAAGNVTYDLVKPCTRCSYTRVEKSNVAVTVELITATCVTAGDARITYKDPTRPGFVVSCVIEIPATGDHVLGSKYMSQLRDVDGRLNITKHKDLNVRILNGAQINACGVDYEAYYVCETCNRSFTITIYRGHDYVNWEKVLDPTCVAVGKESSTCEYNDCDEVAYRDISMIPHEFDYFERTLVIQSGLIDPARVEIVGICKKCNSATEIITGFDSVEIKEVDDPNCIEDGRRVYVCKKGAEEYEIIVELFEERHAIGSDHKDIEDFLNPDGTINSDVEGIYIIEDSYLGNNRYRGGYICSYCNKFVELIVIRVSED